ncbi:MAG: lysylphosphatidylglycerol synthase transmembrane domain-containing protein [Elusimicrobiota bacterium]
MRKKIAAFFAGLILSLIFLYLLFKNINFSDILSYYSKMNYFWLIPFAAVLTLQLALRAVKWRMMLSPFAKTDFYSVFKLETAGLAVNNILPFRIGELARAFMGAKMFKVSSVSVFSTIVLERAVDFLAMVLIFAFFSRAENFTLGFFKSDYFSYIAVIALLFFVFMLFSDKIFKSSFYISFSKKYPSLSAFSKKVMDGLKSFDNPLRGILILAVSVVQWLCEALNNYMFALAFGLGAFINFNKAALILCSTAVGVSLPSAPGYFGNFEFAAVQTMSLWGVQKEAALAYASALHLSGYFIMTVLGIYYVYSLGHSLSSIFELGKKEK